MNAEIALKSVLGLIGLWFFVVYFWRDFRLDAFRDEVFAIRDRLFMYAANGGISFEHPAYSILRERMNVVIRFAHEFRLTRVVFIMLNQNANLKNEAIVKWEEAVKQLPKPTQTQMKDFNTSMAFAVLKHLAFSSFLMYLVLRPLVALIKVVKIDVRSEVVNRPQVVETVERLESDALEQEARLLGRKAPPQLPSLGTA